MSMKLLKRDFDMEINTFVAEDNDCHDFIVHFNDVCFSNFMTWSQSLITLFLNMVNILLQTATYHNNARTMQGISVSCYSFACVFVKSFWSNVHLPLMHFACNAFIRFLIKMWLAYHYIMAGHAIVVVKDINLLFYHGNAVILTLW